MRALTVKPGEPHSIRLDDVAQPRMDEGSVLVRALMLGICGTQSDLPMLEQMIRSDQREIKTALDAMIACYLTLKGPQGMSLVEDLFLKNKKAEYTDTYAAIMALRFHGQEEQVVPKERLVAGLRHMLDRPELADLVIPDLARWQDWSACCCPA